jgi:hypothetical protein
VATGEKITDKTLTEWNEPINLLSGTEEKNHNETHTSIDNAKSFS